MKILHSADWHLDSPLQGFTDAQRSSLKQNLLQVPMKIAELCVREDCQMVLLSGDLFDGPCSKESYFVVRKALENCGVPVFIAPGNHDYVGLSSPWQQEKWPENVHIFTSQQTESVAVPELDCRVYGAGYTGMDCPALLDNFQVQGQEKYQIGVYHGDPTSVNSPYNPVSRRQVQTCGLTYLALGHIHRAGSFRAGKTLCAWPGCPMGRGFDETGEKGVLIAELEDSLVFTQFKSLEFPQFRELEAQAGGDPVMTLEKLLPPVGNDDFYRITLTGESRPLDIPELTEHFGDFPNLQLRDQTTAPVDLWESAGTDTFEGKYFALLQQALEQAAPGEQETIRLAAEISRQILEGREVTLP